MLTGGALEVEGVVGRQNEAARGLVDGIAPVLHMNGAYTHAP